jgi:hypothetical protein
MVTEEARQLRTIAEVQYKTRRRNGQNRLEEEAGGAPNCQNPMNLRSEANGLLHQNLYGGMVASVPRCPFTSLHMRMHACSCFPGLHLSNTVRLLSHVYCNRS